MSERYTQTDRTKAMAIFALEQAIRSGHYDADYIPIIESCITAIRNAGANEVHILLNTPPTSNILNNFIGEKLYGTWAITKVNAEKKECQCLHSSPKEQEAPANNAKNDKATKKKPNAVLSVIFSIISLISFYISYGIINGVLSLIVYFLIKVPVLKILLKWIISAREDTLDGFILTMALFFSLMFIYWLISRITKNEGTMKLTMSIFGVLLIVLNTLALIGSIISNGELYSYIVAIIAGIFFLYQGRKNG